MPTSARLLKSVQAVLSALDALHHPTAQEVATWLNQSGGPKTVSLTTTYRALNHLVETGQAKPVFFNDGQLRYERVRPGHPHHHHFVCTACNQVQVVDLCPFDAVLEAQISQELGQSVQVLYHNFEVFGLCGPCRNRTSDLTSAQ